MLAIAAISVLLTNGAFAQTPAPAGNAQYQSFENEMGLTMALPDGWDVYDIAEPGGGNYGPAVVFGPAKMNGNMIMVESDPANKRDLAQYLKDSKKEFQGFPGEPRPFKICNGKQDGLKVDIVNKPDGLVGEAILAINAKKGIIASYMRSTKTAEMAQARIAVESFCLR